MILKPIRSKYLNMDNKAISSIQVNVPSPASDFCLEKVKVVGHKVHRFANPCLVPQ